MALDIHFNNDESSPPILNPPEAQVEVVSAFQKSVGLKDVYIKTRALDLWINQNPYRLSPTILSEIKRGQVRYQEWRNVLKDDFFATTHAPISSTFSPVLARLVGENPDVDVRYSLSEESRLQDAVVKKCRVEVSAPSTKPDLHIYKYFPRGRVLSGEVIPTELPYIEALPLEGEWDSLRSSLEQTLYTRSASGQIKYYDSPAIRNGRFVCQVSGVEFPETQFDQLVLFFNRCRTISYASFYKSSLEDFHGNVPDREKRLNISTMLDSISEYEGADLSSCIMILQRALGEIHKTIELFPEDSLFHYKSLGILNDQQISVLKKNIGRNGSFQFSDVIDQIIGKEKFLNLVRKSVKLVQLEAEGNEKIDFYAFDFWIRQMGLSIENVLDLDK